MLKYQESVTVGSSSIPKSEEQVEKNGITRTQRELGAMK